MTTSVNKLSPWSIHCVLLGYVNNYNGYKCLDPLLNRFYISHHLCFHENNFVFQELSHWAPSHLQLPTFKIDEVFVLATTYPYLLSLTSSSLTAPAHSIYPKIFSSSTDTIHSIDCNALGFAYNPYLAQPLTHVTSSLISNKIDEIFALATT